MRIAFAIKLCWDEDTIEEDHSGSKILLKRAWISSSLLRGCFYHVYLAFKYCLCTSCCVPMDIIVYGCVEPEMNPLWLPSPLKSRLRFGWDLLLLWKVEYVSIVRLQRYSLLVNFQEAWSRFLHQQMVSLSGPSLKWIARGCLIISLSMTSRMGGKEGVTIIYNKKLSYNTKSWGVRRELSFTQNLWMTSTRSFGFDSLKNCFNG